MLSVAARKRMIFASWAVAGLVAVVSLLDLATGLPYGRQVVMDALFLLGAGLTAYLAYDAFTDIS